MKEKDKWALEFLDSIKDMERRPGMTDIFLAGFTCAKEKIMDLCDAEKCIVTYAEVNRVGEKVVR
jgi:hypothetical protein